MTGILWYHQLSMATQGHHGNHFVVIPTIFPQNARNVHRLSNMENPYNTVYLFIFSAYSPPHPARTDHKLVNKKCCNKNTLKS